MNIFGIGSISAIGRGKDALKKAIAADRGQVNRNDCDESTGFVVADDLLKGPSVLKKMRRADRFTKMTLLAAADAIDDSALDEIDPEQIGVVFATALGPHNTTFKFLDYILDYGDADVSPTVFSHSVHGAAVSYISTKLGIKGPVWTVCKFDNPFREAVSVAQSWLNEGRCEYVLVGGGDERGEVFDHICAQDGSTLSQAYSCGEGVSFFLVSNKAGEMPWPESVKDFSHLSGSMFSIEAFNTAATLIAEF